VDQQPEKERESAYAFPLHEVPLNGQPGMVPYPPGVYPQPGYPQQGYPPQGFPQQQGFPQPVYPPQAYPPQGYPPQGIPQMEQFSPQQTIFVTDGLFDATPFVPTSETFSQQVAKLPRYMVTAVLNPKVATYRALKMNASWSMVVFVLCLKVVIEVVLALSSVAITRRTDPYASAIWYNATGTVVIRSAFYVPLGFFCVNGLYAAFARCLNGVRPELISHPTFMQYCFVSLLVGFPLDILSGTLGLIPVFGIYLWFAVWVYKLVLCVLSLQGVYHLTVGQAIGVILLFVVVCLVFFGSLVLVFSFAILSLFLH